MKAIAMILLATLPALVGCTEPTPGTTRPMGDVQYEMAFAGARDVLIRNDFPIAEANAESGVIRSRPRETNGPSEGLLGGSNPTRQVATMTLRREGEQVLAQLAVAIQEERSRVHRIQRRSEDIYSDVPNQSPSELGAAATPQQRSDWVVKRYDKGLERRLLDDLYRALHPSAQK